MLIQFFSLIFLIHASLLIHYKFWTSFGQAFNDYSGNGNHAVNGDSTAIETTDAIPTARGLYMNGSRVRLPPNELVPGGFATGTRFSMTCWIKSFQPDFNIFQKEFAAPEYLRWRHFVQMIHIEMDEGTGFQYLHCDVTSYISNYWEFLIVTVDMSSPNFVITMPGFSGCYYSNTVYHYIDSPTVITYLGNPLNGVVYEFRFYDHLLSPAEYSLLSVSPGSGGCICSVPCATEPVDTCLSSCTSAQVLDDCSTSCTCGSAGCQGTASTCLQCHPQCKNSMCVGLSLLNCVLGSSCHPACLTCSGVTNSDCLSCSDPNTTLVAGVCSCLPGFYLSTPNPFLCLLCNPSCLTCSGPSDSDCLSCLISASLHGTAPSSCDCDLGFFPNPTAANCQACAPACKACSSSRNDACTLCYPNAERVGTAPSKCECADGLFPDPTPGHCSACFPNCHTCVSRKPTGCLSCFDFADFSEPSPSSCNCTSGYFESANRCLPCNDSCETCETANSCTTCKSGASIASSSSGFCKCNPGFFLYEKSCLPCLDICATCLDATTCITCKANAKLKDSTCTCIDGFFGSAASCQAGGSPSECRAGQVMLNGACMDSCPIGQKPNDSQICESVAIPTVSLTVTAENDLIAEFSKPMACEVTANDVSVEATTSDDTTIDCSVLAANFTDPQALFITLAYISDYIPSGSIATLLFFFPERITDRDTLAISQDSYTVALSPKGNQPHTTAPMLQTPIAQQTAAAAKGAASTGMALSALNSSPASLISSVNLFQLIAYVPLANIPLPTDFASALAALNVGQMIPNPLATDLPRNDTSQLPSRMKDYGIETSLFLPNIASFGGISVLILLSYAPIWLLSRSNLPVISLYFSKLLHGFKWNTPITLCIVLYLDVGFYSFLQVLNSSAESVYFFINTSLSYVFCSVFLSVPIGLLLFFRWNYAELTSVEGNKEFGQRWKILIEPFKRKYEGVIYYFLFATRRVFVVLLLHFGTPKSSALYNALFSVVVRLRQVLFYVFFTRPFSSLLDYLESLFVESCTSIVFLLTAIFLADLSDDTQSSLEQFGLWVIKCVMVGSILIPVVRLIAGIAEAVKAYRKKLAQVEAQRKKSVHDK